MDTLLAGPVALLAPAILGLDWDYTLRNVVLGSAILGVVGGVLGSFATLRRQSLLGDTLAHAALPGVCAAFIITGARESLPLMIGAGISGLIGTLLFLLITRTSRIKEDAGLGIILSVGFGLGILLLTTIQHSGQSGQSGLDRFLFGQAASLITADVITMGILGTAALIAVVLFFKEFKLISFDPDFASSIGYPTTFLTILITALLIVAVVIGLQAVGVILVVAILIAPASAARQWTDRLSSMLALAGAFGALSGVVGAVMSSEIERLPTGPTVVLVATLIAGVSILFAPRRGLVWGTLKRWQHRRQVQLAAVLRDLAEASRGGAAGAVSLAAIANQSGASADALSRLLGTLSRQGLVKHIAGGDQAWELTETGKVAAREALRRERIWKRYMANQMHLSVDAVHVNSSDVEQLLPPEILAGIEAELLAEDAASANGPSPSAQPVSAPDSGADQARSERMV